MNIRLFNLASLLLFFLSPAFAQVKADSLAMKDTLYFMNGEIMTTRVLDTLPELIYCTHPKPTKKHPDKKLLLEKERLFAIKYGNGGEKVLYFYDTLAGNFFTIPEMRDFVTGEQDALRSFKGRPEFWGGVGVGFASGATLPYFLGGTFWSYIPVFAYTGIILAPKVRVVGIRDPKYKQSVPYLLGYERIARKKKIIGALKGGAIGLIAGFATYYTYSSISGK